MFKSKAFTIVELLVVIVIIGILATVVLVSYSGVTQRANDVSLAIDLKNAATKLKAYQSQYGSYPASLDALGCPVASGNLPADKNYCVSLTGTNSLYSYSTGGQTFSVILKSAANKYLQSTESVAQAAYSVPSNGSFMQTITNANCPSTRTRAQDARDTKTYWVQKLADGKCWMLTNLAYAGGGTNTYADVKSINNGIGGSASYTSPQYVVNPVVTNIFSSEPNSPSSNTDGTGQFGYYYNYCAAMGAQLSNEACSSSFSTPPDFSISICPSGWRVPILSEYTALNNSINGGLTNSDSGLKNNFLVVLSGYGSESAGFYNYIGGPDSQFYYVFWTASYSSYPGVGVTTFGWINSVSQFNSTKNSQLSLRCIAN